MTASIDRSSPTGARAMERLATDKIGWLTTINPDGQPQSSPIWFLWEDGEIFIYSAKRAPRNANIEAQPRVAFNLHTDAGGGEVITLEGTARYDPNAPRCSENAAYLEKYGGFLTEYGWDAAYMEREYPYAIRITPTRWRIG